MEWDSGTSRAIGDVLFDSGLTTNVNTGGFEAVTMTPNVALQPNTQYVLFLSASEHFDALSDGARWGQPQNQNIYPGGGFVFQNNGSNFGALTASSWTTSFLGVGADLAFTAQLLAPLDPEPEPEPEPTVVPEPASLTVLGLGLAGLVGYRARRRRGA